MVDPLTKFIQNSGRVNLDIILLKVIFFDPAVDNLILVLFSFDFQNTIIRTILCLDVDAAQTDTPLYDLLLALLKNNRNRLFINRILIYVRVHSQRPVEWLSVASIERSILL